MMLSVMMLAGLALPISQPRLERWPPARHNALGWIGSLSAETLAGCQA